MTRSNRLRPIAELAAQYEKEASIVMVDSQTRLERQELLLKELERYHADYASGVPVANPDPVRLQDYRLFMERLEHAIKRQRDSVAQLRIEFDQYHDQWSSRRVHRKALGKAAGRYARAEVRAADKDEQQQLEEIAALLRSRNP